MPVKPPGLAFLHVHQVDRCRWGNDTVLCKAPARGGDTGLAWSQWESIPSAAGSVSVIVLVPGRPSNIESELI